MSEIATRKPLHYISLLEAAFEVECLHRRLELSVETGECADIRIFVEGILGGYTYEYRGGWTFFEVID